MPDRVRHCEFDRSGSVGRHKPAARNSSFLSSRLSIDVEHQMNLPSFGGGLVRDFA